MQACHPLSPKALLHALLPDETESPPQSPEPSPYRLRRDSSSAGAPSEQPTEHTDLSAIVRRLSHNSEQISRILVDDRSGSVSPQSSRSCASSSNGESPIESPPALTPTRLARRRSDPSPLGQPWSARLRAMSVPEVELGAAAARAALWQKLHEVEAKAVQLAKKAEKHRKLQDEAPSPQRRIVSENKKNEYLRKFERAAMLHAQLEECCRNATAQQQADAAQDPVVEVS